MKLTWYHWTGIGLGVLVLGGFFNRKRVMSNLKEIRLGEFFTVDEFTKTSTGIENIPTEDAIRRLKLLVLNVLDPLRRALGFAITITSGYRSPLVNAAVPGSSDTSQHPKGEAADFKVLFKGKTKEQVLAMIAHKGWNEKNIVWDTKEKCYKLTNQTIIDVIRKLRLPYDQVIDEQRGSSLWVHVSHSANGPQRVMWLTRRDPNTTTRPKEYELVKYGYA